MEGVGAAESVYIEVCARTAEGVLIERGVENKATGRANKHAVSTE